MCAFCYFSFICKSSSRKAASLILYIIQICIKKVLYHIGFDGCMLWVWQYSGKYVRFWIRWKEKFGRVETSWTNKTQWTKPLKDKCLLLYAGYLVIYRLISLILDYPKPNLLLAWALQTYKQQQLCSFVWMSCKHFYRLQKNIPVCGELLDLWVSLTFLV